VGGAEAAEKETLVQEWRQSPPYSTAGPEDADDDGADEVNMPVRRNLSEWSVAEHMDYAVLIQVVTFSDTNFLKSCFILFYF